MFIHQIQLDSRAPRGPLTYSAPNQLDLGTRVEVPVLSSVETGRVVGHGSDYKGCIRAILGVLSEREVTHVLVSKSGDVWLLSQPSTDEYSDGKRIQSEAFCLVAGRGLHANAPGIQPHYVPREAANAWQHGGSFPIEGATLVPAERSVRVRRRV